MKAEEKRTNGLVATALVAADSVASHKAWKAGWVAGIGATVTAVTLAFIVWFRGEAMAQEKATDALTKANAHTDARVAEVKTAVAEKIEPVKSSVDTLTFKVDEQNKKLDDITQAVRELAKQKRERER